MPRTVGIDLGASFSLISYVDKATGQAKCIPGPYGETLCPSIISLEADGSISVGAPAGRRSFSQQEGGIHSLKHLMGRGVDHVPDALKRALCFDSESREVVRVRLGDCVLTPPQISAFILRELGMWAEVFLGGPVSEAVIAVPACFDDAQRQATQEAGTLAGLELSRLVNEPVAAALAYGLHEQRRSHVAVYDLGGRRFEITILKLNPAADGEVYEVISTNGNANVGGDQLDDALLGIAREEIRIRHGLDVENDPQTLQRLRRALVQAKHELSFADRARLEVPLPNRNLYGRDIYRTEFEGLVQPMIEETTGPMQMALADAHLNAGDIDDVVLVGGSTQMLLVRRMVAQFFGQRPHTEINPDEVVALGAAVQADILENDLTVANSRV